MLQRAAAVVSSRAGPRFVGIGYAVAFVAVCLAGAMQALAAARPLAGGEVGWFSSLIGAYALLGTVGVYWVERRGTRAQLYGLLLLTAVLGASATFLSHGYAAMILLGVVSASVLHLSFAASLWVSAGAASVALVAFASRATLWTALIQAEIAFGSGIAFVFVFSRIARREREGRAEIERLVADLTRANAQLEARAHEVQEVATLSERNRIAREIHDGLGHYLTVVHVQLEAAQTLLTAEPERARSAVVKAQQLTHEGLREVRRSVAVLRGATSERPPLIEGLRGLAVECSQAGVFADVHVEGSPRRMTESVEFTLYRAAQEALTNAHRHAHASRVAIALVFTDPHTVYLRVDDDGVGSDTPRAGFGLTSLRERAELVGGQLSITTRPQQGFRLELQVPA